MLVVKFFREVLQEARRVSWPSLRETLSSGLLVAIAAFVAGLFFLLVDTSVYALIKLILLY